MFSTVAHQTFIAACRRQSPKTMKGFPSNVSSLSPIWAINVPSRFYSALSKDEEEKEKTRVASLSKYQKEMELRELDKELARVNTLRGINTGELYTFRGRFKALARDYGFGFMAWYWTVWMSTAALTYGAIEMGAIDAMAIIAKAESYTGYEISSKIDPQLGAIGVTLVFNEMLEPLRLPIVVITTKPIVEKLYPKNY